MPAKILNVNFCLLFFLTPLLWLPFNYELFEYNKMILVYFLTVCISTCWALRMVEEKKVILNRTPLDIPILLFLGANILSTIFSSDVHTSIWGYYSRSNGGLLSIISYTLLFYALVSNLSKEQVVKLLKVGLLSGFLVSLWAIPEHFGVSPSCAVLGGSWNADCWVQDVRSRVFATLGQPNWLAAYLAMLIFPAIYFFIVETKRLWKVIYYINIVALYMAFTFTFSRGATLGLLGGMILLVGLILFQNKIKKFPYLQKNKPTIIIFITIITFIIINLFFGSAWTRFKLLTEAKPIEKSQKATASGTTQLENGGTESGQIRLIVWKGAWEIFRDNPIFGSGVETFAYSYYQYRPAEHNLVSEWDFLYNKAHNEFLNYLATTGAVGFLSYLALIGMFMVWGVKKVYSLRFTVNKKENNFTLYTLNCTLLASYTSYLIQNIFGFSIVIIALFFFLFPAIFCVMSDCIKPLKLKGFVSFKILNVIFGVVGLYFLMLVITSLLQNTSSEVSGFGLILVFLLLCVVIALALKKGILTASILVIGLFFGFNILRVWYADTIFAKGMNHADAGNVGQSYNYLKNAVSLNESEPYFRNELGFAASSASLALSDTDATRSAQLKDEAIEQTEYSLSVSPNNTSFWRTAIRTYYQLSAIDESFNQKTLEAMEKAISLAPTDAKLYYNKALIIGQLGKNDEAIQALEKAVEQKPNYIEAHFALGVFLKDKGEDQKAKEQMEIVLKLIPNHPEATEKLKEWEEK